MTGTSLDGLDVALARITGHGLQMAAQCVGTISEPLGPVRDALLHLASGHGAPPIEYMRAGRRLGQRHADAVEQLCKHYLPQDARLDFIIAHGQTIGHAPDEHLSWQLLDPWPMVKRLDAAVCYDLRQADLIAGGQGAPITPIADWVLFRHQEKHRRIVNLGGVCNVTELPPRCQPHQVTGEDIGPCNLYIDTVVRMFFPDERCDRDGHLSAQGRCVSTMYHGMLDADFFRRPRPRSTGREDFNRPWVEHMVKRCEVTGVDAVASAVEAVGRLIVETTERRPCPVQLVLAGGGAKNPNLVQVIRTRSSGCFDVIQSDELGIACAGREALAFAVLGALSQDAIPITLTQVTGAAGSQIAGVWAYPS